MIIPEKFQFNQQSLSDYIACKRLFLYRYIDKIQWPAVDVEPADVMEHRMKLGAVFHRALQQYFIGVPKMSIESYFTDSMLKRWWRNFENSIDQLLDDAEILSPEIRISASISNQRIVAKLDLIVVNQDGNRIIFDWKTASNRPRKHILSNHMQTRVYPFILVSAGESVYPWTRFSPKQVRMVYWFAEQPGDPEYFSYSEAQFQQDQQFLIDLINEICSLSKADFHKTANKNRCRYCIYRSLCDRGYEAGNFEELSDLFLDDSSEDIEFDFDQIEEIEY